MTARRLFTVLTIAAAAVLPLSAWRSGAHFTLAAAAALQDPILGVTAPAPWLDNDPADSLYRVAREALNKNDYRRAATLFAEIGRKYPASGYIADALYYQAFALYRIGGDDNLREALNSLDAQHARFPKAKTNDDAKALAVRIRGTLAQHGDASSAAAVSVAASDSTPCRHSDSDEGDVRTAAMNALMQMDSENALPIIKQVLQKRDACSAPLRKKAMFLLSQKPTSESESLLIEAAKNDPSHEVRGEAVFWLGQMNSDRAATALEEFATSSPDMSIREKALFSLSQMHSGRGPALLRRLAESNDTPIKIRESAIFQLGQNQSRENAEYLRALFLKLGKGDQNEALRKHVLFSLSQMHDVGNDRWLIGVAQDASQTMEVRKQALFTAGQAGVEAHDLVPLYDHLTERELKEQLIWVLSEMHDKAAGDKVVDIATKDRDPEMRKKAIFWLSQKNDPRIRQILLDIINKP